MIKFPRKLHEGIELIYLRMKIFLMHRNYEYLLFI